MAESLLTALNKSLKRVGMISGDAGDLTSLTDSSRQHAIDVTIQMWNEIIVDLYTASSISLPSEATTDNITLVDGTREYSLPADLEQMRWPLINQTLGHVIYPYPGGFAQMRMDQPIPANYTGRPIYAVINPSTNKLRMNVVPDADADADVYQIFYDKNTSMALAADTFPFSDGVVDSLVPAVAQMYNREEKGKFDAPLFKAALGRSARLLSQKQQRTKW